MRDDNRRLTSATLRATMADGSERPLKVTALGATGFHLGTGLYFGFDGHWHGEWRGDLHADGEHIPDCELEPATLSLQAGSRVADSALREFTRAVARVGLEHRVLESCVRPGHTFLEMAAYTLHPYKLVRGLAIHAERAGVHVRERLAVRSVEGLRSGGARLLLDDGTHLETGKVVLQIALTRLAKHYGLIKEEGSGSRRRRLRHWGDADYRPSLDGRQRDDAGEKSEDGG